MFWEIIWFTAGWVAGIFTAYLMVKMWMAQADKKDRKDSKQKHKRRKMRYK